MPHEIIALIDKPWLLLAVLAVGAGLGMLTERLAEKANKTRRKAWWPTRNRSKFRARNSGNGALGAEIAALKGAPSARRFPDASDQLRIVLGAQFRARPLLNKPEQRLLAHLDRTLAREAPDWRAMAQVSLGEILASEDREAFLAINSKRVDFLLVDAASRPLHAIEFQGTGHHQGSAAARDAVKREALRRAGIGYVEIASGDTPAEIGATIRKLREKAS
ncbi:DUF2726 domain-containing protein [Sphingobium lignivorans]|uniref:DUF2726 domain-containing protein n=1 Tax=Sphingobium lignivorans TaxID=2735886 RepID=A0ABR6NAN5_9SPHN|nr:DUF2726 domain-containing protein [Sphingobium lignivorans]MBB5984342.1 hypothetical protein [Sphingobium lignivorans]